MISQASGEPDDPLQVSVVERLVEVRDRYEAAWRQGQRPRIETFVKETNQAQQSVLIYELLAVELELRRGDGEQPDPEEYRQRFPHHHDVVDAAFSAESSSQPEGSALGDNLPSDPAGDSSGETGADALAPTTICPVHPDLDGARFESHPRSLVQELLESGMVDPPLNSEMAASLGRFHILHDLGKGGMGIVLLAYDPQADQRVALKMMKPDSARSPLEVRRFLREAGHMSRLKHANILRVLEVIDRPQGPCFVMPYFPEGSLAGRLVEWKSLAPRTILHIASRIAKALDYAHKRGLIHRDLKPANVLMDLQGDPHVADFGLARTLFNDSLIDVGHPAWIGTPVYMSPGVARGELEDTRCDIYSFGALLREMLTGEPPYLNGSPREIVRDILAGPPRPILELNPHAHPGLAAIADGAMARELRYRYAEMADVVADLDRVQHGREPLGPHGRRAVGPAPQAGPSPGPRPCAQRFVFRRPGPMKDAGPAQGEICIRLPRDPDLESRAAASLVLAGGLEALPRGTEPIERIVISSDPTLDEMLAASIVASLLDRHALPPGLDAFARYAALAREGLRPGEVPLEDSLEGIYLALRGTAGDDLAAPSAAARFTPGWERMFQVIWTAAEQAADPFATPLFSAGADFARERTFLKRDHEVYRLEDLPHAERWLVSLPGGPPEGSALLLRKPKSLLFKHWARTDRATAAGDSYIFLAVDWGGGQWVFSTDPARRLSLQPLAERLQTAELAHDPARAASDPWFDGKPFGHTLVAAPRGGTAMANPHVLRIVRRWTRAHGNLPGMGA